MTRRVAPMAHLTGTSPVGAVMAPAQQVQPLRVLAEIARSIFEAARELIEQDADPVRS